jgi:phosphate transport system protein
MRETFRSQLESLDKHVIEMADLAKSMLADGLDALEAVDPALAEAVATRATELAKRDEAIETEALSLLMLQAPVAKDLRRIGAILKIITYLNRIGRYGYDIAKATKDLAKNPHKSSIVTLRQMSGDVEKMLDLALAAFRERRDPDIKAIMSLEEDVDAQRYTVWRACLSFMSEDPKNIEPSAHVMMIARYLERCGDNVVKMAEKLHYAATGERILL